jgi:predicted acyltransferase
MVAGMSFRTTSEDRFISLDAFRGFTMIFLVSAGFGISHVPSLEIIAKQFQNHPWHGLRFWDLIQPFFMFIAGVAMPFAFERRWRKGEKWSQSFAHVVRRSLILMSLGILIQCVGSRSIDIRLFNVLCALAIAYFFTFLTLKKPIRIQIAISLLILLANYVAYRMYPVALGQSHWAPNANLGSFLDRTLFGGIYPTGGGWVTITFVGPS